MTITTITRTTATKNAGASGWMGKKPLISHEEVCKRINEGEILVIWQGHVLKLDKWLARHPGGDLAVMHMVGRDATDEIEVYHSAETIATMKAWSIGEVELPWTSIVPPVERGTFETSDAPKPAEKIVQETLAKEKQADVERYPELSQEMQDKIREKFRELHRELEEADMFKCNYYAYAAEAARISLLFVLSIFLFIHRQDSLLRIAASATFLGLAWHQIVFIVHDAGHLGITHNYYVDNFIGAGLASFVGGLSCGWWKRNHNVHHIVTNDPVHDPDIQHLPFFAVTSELLLSVWSTFYEKVIAYDAAARVLLRFQHHLYYPILCFGRFNLYRLSWIYVLYGLGPTQGKAKYLRHFELVGLSFFMIWFFYGVVGCALHTWSQRLVFVLVSHIVTMPVHVQITLSHFAQSTANMGPIESFAQRQVRTTMDVACPPWFDFVHGGLQFQVIHHLFPRMPRHNLRRAQARVIEFCEGLDLKYTIYGFVRGNRNVIDRLYDISQQAAVFNECNDFCRQEILKQPERPLSQRFMIN